jgi:Tol biopolymer transport system component
MRRVIALASVFGITLLSLGAVAPARAVNPPGTNGKIAYYRDGEGGGVLTIDPDGTNEHSLGTKAELGGDVTGAAWSPDGSKLLVSIFLTGGGTSPATVNPDGSDFTLLDANPDLNPPCTSWSSDGTRLLCEAAESTQRPNTNGIYTVRSSDGGDLQRVVKTPWPGNEHIDIPLGYSPDDTQILFNRERKPSHHGRLFVVQPDGSGLTQISPAGMVVQEADCGAMADWSPDGSRVAFAGYWKSGKGNGTALFVVNPDGTGLHRISPYGAGGIAGTQWSPDGERIAFSAVFLERHHQIWAVDPDGTRLSELTSRGHGDAACNPVWSPDSTKLVFVGFHPEIGDGQQDLWTVNADGTGLFQVTNTPQPLNENSPAWGSAPTGN